MVDKKIYKKYLKSLFDYMVQEGYTSMPYPKIAIDDTDQGNDVFMKTGYMDPEKKMIRIFSHDRALKDQLRTAAHEFVHWGQMIKGDIEKSGYSSDKITEDKNLIHLEAEAYLKGNMAFRSWTEIEQKNKKNGN